MKYKKCTECGIKVFINIIFVFLTLNACDEKQTIAVYDLLVFRTELKEHCFDYSQAEWEDAIDRYANICQRLEKMHFTEEERLEIDRIKGEIAGYAATVAVQEVSDEVQTIVNEIESFAEGFEKTFQLP